MRPIKFKGKAVNPFDNWVFGCYVTTTDSATEKVTHYIGENGYYTVVAPETVCQLIKVVNGVEIYEGDYDEEGNMIDYCEECMGYQFFKIDELKDVIFCHNCDGNFMVQDHIDEFKVVGNIND